MRHPPGCNKKRDTRQGALYFIYIYVHVYILYFYVFVAFNAYRTAISTFENEHPAQLGTTNRATPVSRLASVVVT